MKRLIAHLIALTAAGALFAGPPPAKQAAPVIPPAAPNPLSFFDGKLTFDIEEKMRAEVRENNFDFNSGLNSLTDDSWLLQRARLGLLYKPTSWLRIYAQGQDLREIDSDRPNVIGQLGAEGDDTIDLLEGWLDIGDPTALSFRAGRQKLSFGDQRLVGPLEWLNPSRTFDALKLKYSGKTYTFDLFASSVVPFVDSEFNQSDFTNSDSTRDQIFSGAYLATQWVSINKTTDFYAFHLSESQLAGDVNFVTLGTLWKGDPKKLSGWDYTTEMAFQVGTFQDKDLTAFAGHWEVGYNWLNTGWKPRLALQYNYGTGDSNAKDGKVGTFQNLFPTNHLFYGFMDTTGWANMHNPQINLSLWPTAKLKLMLDYHLYWMADSADAWYRVNGVTRVRPINANASSYRGSEFDVTAIYKVNKNLSLQAGYSVFFAGAYLNDTGAADDAHFGYAQIQINF